MSKKNEQLIINNMIDKSIDSFLLAIELFNKPTIKLNVEGFCIFMCNAWDLMLKAYLLKNNQKIYYKDKQKQQRTYDLSRMVRLVFTNSKDPLRVNLETVIGIRNKATHLIIPEYANLLHDVFTACVNNYNEKLLSMLGVNISDRFSSTYLSLVIPTSKTTFNILGKYGKQIDTDYYNTSKFLEESYKAFSSKDNNVHQSLAVRHQMTFVRIKDKDEANIKVAHYKDDESRKIVKVTELKDPSETHPLTRNAVLDKVKEEINRQGLSFTPYTLNKNTVFTSDTFSLFCRMFDVKNNEKYAYKHVVGNAISYTYSYDLIEKIISEITNNEDLFYDYKKTNPRGNGNS